MKKVKRACMASLLGFGAALPLAPALANAVPGDLAELSLEELSNIAVTSVSKRPESIAEAPASIFVITAENIRRSGVSSLAEALRLAPNLQIARVDARNYAVTARGFNNPFENKLLVLIDGRTVYSPLFSGVFWDAQDVVMEDIERIEVISGPGATLWGANAVNGVINVITRSAHDTQGALLSAGASNRETSDAVRYGGTLANGSFYRAYAKHADNDDTHRADGKSLVEGWQRSQAGFRIDSADGSLTFKGDAYQGHLHQAGTNDIDIAGANLLARSEQALASGGQLHLQAYLDYTDRAQPLAFIEHLTTLDLEAQYANQLGAHQLVWGGGYRLARDLIDNATGFAFLPGNLNLSWSNLFVQDEIALKEGLKLTAGAKLEHNSYTGLEFLPNLRLAWKNAPGQLLWSSLSRAVRAPSRIDRDLYAPANPAIVNGVPQYGIGGGPDFDSEVARVIELGYRAQPMSTMSFSVTAFHANYERLRTLEPNPSGPGSVFLNKAHGDTAGVEMWGSWQPLPAWRLSAGLVGQRIRTQLDPGSHDTGGAANLANNDPSAYWMLRSSVDISDRQELDMTVRHVGALPMPAVPGYTTLDLRYGWKISPALEVSLTGRNLVGSTHVEFGAPATGSEVERSVFVKLLWRWNK